MVLLAWFWQEWSNDSRQDSDKKLCLHSEHWVQFVKLEKMTKIGTAIFKYTT